MEKSDFEKYPPDMPKDETDVNVRAYFTLMDDAKIDRYDPSWSDEQLMEWDGNFKSDGSLMLICSERDVEIDEYRRVLEQYIEFRKKLLAEARS
jgi:hypothetical protein